MQFVDILKARSAYVYILAGIVWLGLAADAGSYLILWPVVACIASGALLIMRPGERFTWSWVLATAVLGLLLAGYQIYSWAPFVSGPFAVVAAEAVVIFLALAVLHGLLLFVAAPKSAKSEPTPKTS